MAATAVFGNFTNFTPAQLNHTNFGAGNWIPIAWDNSFKDEAGFGPALADPPVWATSGLTWECPAEWRIEGGSTNPMNGWMQRISIDVNQTTKVDKFDKWMSRSVSGQIKVH